MENLQGNTAELLNQLVEINNDRIEGYEKAISLLPNEDSYNLHAIFARYKDQSVQFNNELKPLVAKEGEIPTDDTRISGKIFRTWMAIKSVVAPYTMKAVLESCERGEDEFKKVYQNVLERISVNNSSYTVIQNQANIQKGAHDHIKELRDHIKEE